MNCNVCTLADETTIELIHSLLIEGRTNNQIIVHLKRENPENPLTVKDIAAHKAHQTTADERIQFYFKDGEIYDSKTNEIVPRIGAREALDIIITLGAYQILKNGGSRLSARYVVEAAKIVAELGQDDTISKSITEAWKAKLREKRPDVTVEVTEASEEATKLYYRNQQESKEGFLAKVKANRANESR